MVIRFNLLKNENSLHLIIRNAIPRWNWDKSHRNNETLNKTGIKLIESKGNFATKTHYCCWIFCLRFLSILISFNGITTMLHNLIGNYFTIDALLSCFSTFAFYVFSHFSFNLYFYYFPFKLVKHYI